MTKSQIVDQFESNLDSLSYEQLEEFELFLDMNPEFQAVRMRVLSKIEMRRDVLHKCELMLATNGYRYDIKKLKIPAYITSLTDAISIMQLDELSMFDKEFDKIKNKHAYAPTIRATIERRFSQLKNIAA